MSFAVGQVFQLKCCYAQVFLSLVGETWGMCFGYPWTGLWKDGIFSFINILMKQIKVVFPYLEKYDIFQWRGYETT